MAMMNYTTMIDPELGRLIKTRSRLGTLAPAYAGIVYGMPLVETTRTKTMAVDGRSMFWNREFIRRTSDKELLGTVLHEGLHVTLAHPLRRAGRNPKQWNVACDYVINPIVIKAGLDLPEGALLNWDYDGMTAEQVYKLLEKEQPEGGDGPDGGDFGEPSDDGAEAGGGGDAGDDSGDESDDTGDSGKAGDNGDGTDDDSGEGKDDADADDDEPSGKPEDFDQAGEVWDQTNDEGDALDATEIEKELDELNKRIITAALAEKATGSGSINVDGGILDAAQTKPVDWREALADFLNRSCAGESTFAVPNRRHLGRGDYFPSERGVGGGDLVIAIDTSGSVSQQEADAFAGEIDSIRETIKPERTVVIYCDRRIQKNADGGLYDLFETHEDIKVRNIKGGGTDFDPPFYLTEREGFEVDAFIYFTDGYASVSEKVCGLVDYPVLWATTGATPNFYGNKFGEVIEVAF